MNQLVVDGTLTKRIASRHRKLGMIAGPNRSGMS
jgi:hypothetical protein